jgi:hypothetical protein
MKMASLKNGSNPPMALAKALNPEAAAATKLPGHDVSLLKQTPAQALANVPGKGTSDESTLAVLKPANLKNSRCPESRLPSASSFTVTIGRKSASKTICAAFVFTK